MTALTKSRGTGFGRLLSAYVAMVLLVAVTGPGIAVYAEDTGEVSGSLEASQTVAAEAPAEEPVALPEDSTPPAEGQPAVADGVPVLAAAEMSPGGPDKLAAKGIGDIAPAAVVPGTSTNLSFTFEGVRKSSGWVTGNLQGYDEGEWVPYRLIITNKDKTNSVLVPTTTIQLDHFMGPGIMYDRTRMWGTFTTATEPKTSDTWYPAITPVTPTSQDVPVNPAVLGSAELIKTTLSQGYLVIPPGEYGVLYFQAHLAVTAYWNMQTPSRDGAGPIPGSSGHGSLDMTGVGAKTVPLPSVPVPNSSISGVKFYDYDRDGIKDANEPVLAGWTITLEGGEPGFEIGTLTDVTDVNGVYSFSPLPPGVYSLNEVLQPQWTNSTALPLSVTLGSGDDQVRNIGNYHDDVTKTFRLTYAGIPSGAQPYVRYAVNGGTPVDVALTGSPLQASVPVPYGAALTTIEWRVKYGTEDLLLGVSPTPEILTADKLNSFTYAASLAGSKFSDLDKDGIWDAGEEGLAGWTIKLWRGGLPYAETVTGTGGAYSFAGLLPGSYTLSEVQQGGWVNTVAPAGSLTVINGTAMTGLDFGNVAIYPEIEVVKTADPAQVPETGAPVNFSFTITNHTSVFPVTVTSISDDVFGDLLPEAKAQNGGLDIVLAPGAAYTFSITRMLASDTLTPHTNTVTVVAFDDYGRSDSDEDDATVTFEDVPPAIKVVKTAEPGTVPETGGNVLFTITVENIGSEAVDLTDAVDTVFGTIDVSLFDKTHLHVGDVASYSFTEWMAGEPAAPHHNVVTVTAEDNEGTPASDDDDADVAYVDVLPTLQVVKDVTPGYLDEPGGTFAYEVRVKNTSVESVKLTIVEDDVYGVIYEWSAGDPEIWLLPNEVKVFEFTMEHTQAGQYENTAEATAVDNDGSTGWDDDDATALVGDVVPVVEIDKSVDVASLPEPGGEFTFTLTIRNRGVEPFEITSLTDTNLSEPYPAAVAALIGQTIEPGGELSASYTLTHTEAGVYDNVAVVEVEDNEGSTDTDSDDESVTVTDVAPVVEIVKTTAPASLPEPGGEFTFTLTIRNRGVEPFEITSLTDTNLSEPYPAAVAALIGQTIEPGGELSASYTLTHTEAGVYDNVAVVEVEDNEGSTDTDSDDESVTVTDVLPTLQVVKDVTPGYLDEPGGTFAYEVRVKNTSVESVKLTIVEDDVYGVIYEWSAGDPEIWLLPNEVKVFEFTMEHTQSGVYENVAEATAVDNEANSASDDDDATALVGDVPPVVEIDKSVDVASLPEPGGEFTFTLTIRNRGVEPFEITSLTDTNLSEPYPAAVAALIGQTIEPGGELSASYTLTHTEAGVYDNVAVVEVEDNEGSTDTDSDDESVTVTDVLPTLQVLKDVTPASLPEPGGEFGYTATVTNTSDEPVQVMVVEDDVYGVIYQWTEGSPAIWLVPDESRDFTFALEHVEVGEYANTASATVKDNEGNSASDDDDALATVTDVLPTIDVVKSAEPLEMNVPGGTFAYTVTVTNTSIEPVQILLVEDDVYGIVYEWVDGEMVAAAESVAIWLAPGESRVFEFSVEHTEPGAYPNTATVIAVDDDGNEVSGSDDAVVYVYNPAIDVEKTSDAPDSLVAEGTLVTYTYVVTNVGDVPLFNVVLTDDQLGVVGTLESLAVGESKAFTASATLTATTTNIVVAVGEDKNGVEVSDEDTLTVETFRPFTDIDLAIEKSASDDVFEPGDVITYTLRYQNLGTKPATDFTITDDFDERYVTVIDAKGGTVADGKITWTVAGPLAAADGVQTLTYTVRVKSDMPDGTTAVDNVVVISHPDDSDLTNNTDKVSVDVKEEPYLPFTGGDAMLLILVAFASAVTGLFLRRRTA